MISQGSSLAGLALPEDTRYGDLCEDLHHPKWNRRLYEYDSDDIEDDEDAQDDSIRNHSQQWDWKPQEKPIFWNPARFLTLVLLPHKDTLEHLSLTIANIIPAHLSCIQRSHLIRNFKDLTNLKSLEFDSRIIRPRKGMHYEYPPDGIQASLADILPTSVETVRILAFDSEIEILLPTIRSLPRKRAQLPYLSEVCLVLNLKYETEGKLDTWDTEVSKKLLEGLRDELAKLGILLTFETARLDSSYL